MKPRFTTGELARLNGISKQTLIFYDRTGVFSPNEKDPYNGYRYYGADQLEMLDHILILKDMGLSLKEIRAFLSLSGPSDALAVLRRQREALAARQRRLSAALTRLNVKRPARCALKPCRKDGSQRDRSRHRAARLRRTLPLSRFCVWRTTASCPICTRWARA